MPPSLATPERRTEPHSVGFTLAAIGLGITMTGLGLAYAFTTIRTAWLADVTAQADATTVSRTLVGRRLTIPAGWLRDTSLASGAFASRIELAIGLPLGRGGAVTPVAVTLLPLSQARPSASLLDGVYLHQFMPNELSGPPGLVGKPLYGSGGYENETVWYDALSPNPFVAKCAPAPVAGRPAQCLRTVALPGGIAAVYGFDSVVLYSWRKFDMVMGNVLARIGAIDAPAKS
jgi:hypothetical protein